MNPFRLLLLGLSLLAAGCSASPSPPSASGGASMEPVWVEDITSMVGLDFTHDAGPDDLAYFMPRVMGSGGAAFDFDGDGRLDLYLIQNAGPNGPKNRLFQQGADGTFRDVSAGSGLDVAGWGMGVAVGDVNNDGRPDVLLTEFGRTRLFLNLGGGKFREASHEAGIDNPQWGTSAAFFDFDRDGRLDLVIANYLDYNAAQKCESGGRADFCSPNSFPGPVARLYHNIGPGPQAAVRFEDVTIRAGLGLAPGKGLGVLCADFNGDGWPDIFVANDGIANYLWINRHDGTFKEEALSRGLPYPANGQPAANMGIAWGDVDGDGLNDLFVTHIVDETHTLWMQKPRGLFQDRTVAAGLTQGGRSTGFGAAFLDFDCDGRLDLAWVNGGVVRNRGAEPGGPFWAAYAQRNQLFGNSGGGQFRDLSAFNPALCGKPGVGRGLIVADIDNDGAPDLIVTELAGPARVLRNVAPRHGHWLVVRAVLPGEGGRDAYGAEVTVTTSGGSYQRLVNAGGSYCCSSDARTFFGLGSAAGYDAVRVLWPDGRVESFPGGPADRAVVLKRGEGKPAQ